MVILGNALFGHIETGGTGKRMAAGPSSDKSAVAVMLDFKNDSRKTIKTIVFFFLPFDAINHVVLSRAKGWAQAQLKLMGAIQPDEIKRQVYWENVWYSQEIAAVKLMRIDIAYTDGSTESLRDDQIHFDCA